MPIGKEFTIRQEDKPGTLGKPCQALANQNVNILAFQSFPSEKGKSSIHLVLDNHTAAKAVLDQHRVDYTGAREAGSPSGESWDAPHRGWATRESTSTTATAGPRR